MQNQTGVDVRFEVDVLDLQEGAGNSPAGEFVPIGDAPRGAGAWIADIETDEFEVKAAQQYEVPLTIRVPDDAGAGGWYAAIVFTAKDPDPKGQVPIDQTTPVPVLVTVSGEFERDLRVELEPDDRWRWSGGTATWTITLRNEGDVHEVFAGRVRVDGALSSARNRPIRPGILLPGETRRQRVTADLRDAPDLVGATLRVERDEGDPVEDEAPRVLVLPWWLLLLVAAAAAVTWWRLRARRGGHDETWDSDEVDGSWGPSPPAG